MSGVPSNVSYDRIGLGYKRFRKPDPRIAARVTAALGDSQTVVNVGAGTGSYEPADRVTLAVDRMRRWLSSGPQMRRRASGQRLSAYRCSTRASTPLWAF